MATLHHSGSTKQPKGHLNRLVENPKCHNVTVLTPKLRSILAREAGGHAQRKKAVAGISLCACDPQLTE